jgi:caffeoyl-CoA O-methyltransferase
MKKFKSIFIDHFEDFINQELVNRPSNLFFNVEKYAIEAKIPILSPASGEVLKYLITIEKPKQILELGTGLGYSLLWILSSGLPLKVVSLERNQKCISDASNFIDSYKSKNQQVELKETHILQYLRILEELNFDFCFIDCDKICYPEIFLILTQKMKKGSKLLFDNVLWHGRLGSEEFNRPSDTAMKKFWIYVKESNLERTLFPVGDGLLLISV